MCGLICVLIAMMFLILMMNLNYNGRRKAFWMVFQERDKKRMRWMRLGIKVSPYIFQKTKRFQIESLKQRRPKEEQDGRDRKTEKTGRNRKRQEEGRNERSG